MKRNLKALGLALVAALALSAVAVSAASAHTPAKFTTGSHWTELTATSVGLQEFTTADGSTSVECETIKLDETSLGTEATSITAKPTYGATTDVTGATECKINETIDMQAHMNGCHYLFTAGNDVDGEVHIECPSKPIEVTAHILGKWRPCLDIEAQTPTKPTVTYKNETDVVGGKNVWDVKVTPDISGITYTKTGLCGTHATFHDMHMTGEITVTGKDTEGNAVNVTWDPTVN